MRTSPPSGRRILTIGQCLRMSSRGPRHRGQETWRPCSHLRKRLYALAGSRLRAHPPPAPVIQRCPMIHGCMTIFRPAMARVHPRGTPSLPMHRVKVSCHANIAKPHPGSSICVSVPRNMRWGSASSFSATSTSATKWCATPTLSVIRFSSRRLQKRAAAPKPSCSAVFTSWPKRPICCPVRTRPYCCPIWQPAAPWPTWPTSIQWGLAGNSCTRCLAMSSTTGAACRSCRLPT